MAYVYATADQRDAHHKALRWSHVVSWQVERLYDARREVVSAQARSAITTYYGPDEANAFHRLAAEAHFTLVAARQLLRALRAFDGDDRLPTGLGNEELRTLRDAMEHWDNPGGPATTRLAAIDADPGAHQWSADGPGLLGKLIADSQLKDWADAVHAELTAWSPTLGPPTT